MNFDLNGCRRIYGLMIKDICCMSKRSSSCVGFTRIERESLFGMVANGFSSDYFKMSSINRIDLLVLWNLIIDHLESLRSVTKV